MSRKNHCGSDCKYYSSGLDEPRVCKGGHQAELDAWWEANGEKLEGVEDIACFEPNEWLKRLRGMVDSVEGFII